MKKFFVILIALMLAAAAGYAVLAAGSRLLPPTEWQTAPSADGTSSSASGNDSMTETMPQLSGQNMGADLGSSADIGYEDYHTGVIGGRKLLLFFRSAGETGSTNSDSVLSSIYFAGKAAISTYKVDFDAMPTLGKKYGVETQNTFVLLDESGKILKTKTDPSPDAVLELVNP